MTISSFPISLPPLIILIHSLQYLWTQQSLTITESRIPSSLGSHLYLPPYQVSGSWFNPLHSSQLSCLSLSSLFFLSSQQWKSLLTTFPPPVSALLLPFPLQLIFTRVMTHHFQFQKSIPYIFNTSKMAYVFSWTQPNLAFAPTFTSKLLFSQSAMIFMLLNSMDISQSSILLTHQRHLKQLLLLSTWNTFTSGYQDTKLIVFFLSHYLIYLTFFYRYLTSLQTLND